jgi:hypothetical protein
MPKCKKILTRKNEISSQEIRTSGICFDICCAKLSARDDKGAGRIARGNG